MRALAIAATGMSAQQLNVEVVANNIANINTTSYKRSARRNSPICSIRLIVCRVSRTGLVRERCREGAKLGLGVRSTAVRKLHLQGALAQTGNAYDLAVNGRGWFQIVGPNGDTLYTRAGSFNTNADGQLVTADGYNVETAILIPQGTVEVTVNELGQVFAKLDNEVVRCVRWVGSPLPTLRERGWARSARRQSLQGDDRVRHSGCRRSR